MRWQAPAFWYDGSRPYLKTLLYPFSRFYAWMVRQRSELYYPVPLARPVICVGNLVTGGAGKTPVVLSLVQMLKDRGYNPHILTRGYGGSETGPLQVSPGRDTAADVGDEALLLVEKAPTWVSTSRPIGAQEAIDTGANLIVMDDGLQNPSIYKDFSFLVIDGATGFGNGAVMPAGPLREDLTTGIARAHAVIMIGEDRTGAGDIIRGYADIPVFPAALKADPANPDLFGKAVFAFAGIGRPEKFRASLVAAGAMLEGWGSFPDHYPYTEEDLKELMEAAVTKGAIVVTTAKDHVRLPPALKEKVTQFRVILEWQDPAAVLLAIEEKLLIRPA